MNQIEREHGGTPGWRVSVYSLADEIVGRSRPMLITLFGAVSLVLLIACVNAANLLLARATSRRREIAIRAAIGARRSRLIRQMLTESLLISLLGAIFGTGVAVAGVKYLVSFLPADFPRAADIHISGIVLAFTLAIAVATGIFFGLAPAWQGASADLRSPLHEGGRSSTSGSGSLRFRNTLVVLEVAFACVLLIGAGLMLRSFLNLLSTARGFQPERVLTASISLPYPRYKDIDSSVQFCRKLTDALAASPGVRSAGAGSDLPWTGYDENAGGFLVEGQTPAPGNQTHARYHVASSGYFQALGIPLLKGRFFSERDGKDAPTVVLINESMAKRYWGGDNAVGKRISFSDKPKEKDWMTVVGVVGDVKDTPASSAAEPAFWWPLAQQPFLFSNISVVIRGETNPSVLRVVTAAIDSDLAVADVRTMENVAGESYSASRFTMLLVRLFAGLAIVLAAIGTYGVIAYAVNQRGPEFGIRMALGARPANVMMSVLRSGMTLSTFGCAVGVLVGLALAKLLGTLLYEVKPSDPMTVAVAFLITLFSSALACIVPAWRATRNDPMNMLRAD